MNNQPFCYICKMAYSEGYLLTHLRVDHDKAELANALAEIYFEDYDEQQAMMENAQVVE